MEDRLKRRYNFRRDDTGLQRPYDRAGTLIFRIPVREFAVEITTGSSLTGRVSTKRQEHRSSDSHSAAQAPSDHLDDYTQKTEMDAMHWHRTLMQIIDPQAQEQVFESPRLTPE